MQSAGRQRQTKGPGPVLGVARRAAVRGYFNSSCKYSFKCSLIVMGSLEGSFKGSAKAALSGSFRVIIWPRRASMRCCRVCMGLLCRVPLGVPFSVPLRVFSSGTVMDQTGLGFGV